MQYTVFKNIYFKTTVITYYDHHVVIYLFHKSPKKRKSSYCFPYYYNGQGLKTSKTT